MPRVTITIPDKVPQPYRFPFERSAITLGRGSRNDIVIDCPSVSVNHAELHRHASGYEIKDLGSTNGIKLAGERHESIPLQHGSLVKLGDVELVFELSDEEMDALGLDKPAKEAPPMPEEPAAESVEGEEDADSSPDEAACACTAWQVFWLLVLIALALVAGMAVRHQLDTGHSWFDALRGHFLAPTTAPAE